MPTQMYNNSESHFHYTVIKLKAAESSRVSYSYNTNGLNSKAV